jgi:hypothetical protein
MPTPESLLFPPGNKAEEIRIGRARRLLCFRQSRVTIHTARLPRRTSAQLNNDSSFPTIASVSTTVSTSRRWPSGADHAATNAID